MTAHLISIRNPACSLEKIASDFFDTAPVSGGKKRGFCRQPRRAATPGPAALDSPQKRGALISVGG
jgi:hypothetical protein